MLTQQSPHHFKIYFEEIKFIYQLPSKSHQIHVTQASHVTCKNKLQHAKD